MFSIVGDDVKYGGHKCNSRIYLAENLAEKRVGLVGCNGSKFCGNGFARQSAWLRPETDKYNPHFSLKDKSLTNLSPIVF
jgi:hypothetical protein